MQILSTENTPAKHTNNFLKIISPRFKICLTLQKKKKENETNPSLFSFLKCTQAGQLAHIEKKKHKHYPLKWMAYNLSCHEAAAVIKRWRT